MFLGAFLIAVAYVQIGEAEGSIIVAKKVPLICKWFLGLMLFASVWFTGWRILAGVSRPDLRPVGDGLLLWNGFIAFSFAVASGDKRGLFFVCTFMCILCLIALEGYYWRKFRRQDAAKGL